MKSIIAAVAVLAFSVPVLGHAQDQGGKALYDSKGNYQGIARPDSAGGYNIVDKQGQIVAHVDGEGKVTDAQGKFKGRVRPAPAK